MEKLLWCLTIVSSCLILTVFSGNYTFYEGFAHKTNNQTLFNITMDSCVCQCLLTQGCAALTYYNRSQTCSLVADTVITEDDVNLNSTARLLLISANLSQV